MKFTPFFYLNKNDWNEAAISFLLQTLQYQKQKFSILLDLVLLVKIITLQMLMQLDSFISIIKKIELIS